MKSRIKMVLFSALFIVSCAKQMPVEETSQLINGFKGQQQNAYAYVFWKTTAVNTYSSFEQKLQITKKAAASFFATMWGFNDGTGAYMGVQTNLTRSDGTYGDAVIFSIWNASAATGTNCAVFGGEGIGYSCRINFSVDVTKKYRLRLKKGTTAIDGQWWEAYIRNESTYAETKIGSIKSNLNSTALNLPSNFSEYFGEEVSNINNVPQSIVLWSAASLKPVNSYLSVTPVYNSYSIGTGANASVISTTVNYAKVVKTTLGGAQ